MIDETFFEYIRDNLSLAGTFHYGSARGATPPYYILNKISDPERPVVLCEDQGDTGQALFQFSAYAGGEGTVSNAANHIVFLEALKIQVNQIRGVIGTSPDDYTIWFNNTGGVRLLGNGTNILDVWGAMFETTIWWKKL
jgi:hypothetical protein